MQPSSTALGQLLKYRRDQAGLTQQQLEAQLDAGPSYVSKLETGRLRMPAEDVIAKLADFLDKSVDEIRRLCESNDQPVGAPCRLVAGYSVWAAPILLAAAEGLIPGIEVSCLSKIGSSGVRLVSDLEWISPGRYLDELTPRMEGIAPLSAADVAELLQREGVEFGALPGNLVRGDRLRDSVLCVGTITDSSGGCSIVCRSEVADELATIAGEPAGSRSGRRSVGTRDLAILLQNPKSKSTVGRRRVAAEERTIAAEYVTQACRHITSGRRRLSRSNVIWDFRAASVAKTNFDEFESRCVQETNDKLLGIIVWEPLATWLTSTGTRPSKGKPANKPLAAIPLHFTPEDGSGRASHLSYEIVLPRRLLAEPTARRQELFLSMERIMTAVAATAARLNNIESEPASTLCRLSRMYGFLQNEKSTAPTSIACEALARMINGVLYSVRWHVVPELRIGPQC